MLEHKAGTILSTAAEAFSSQSHFDVSVFVDVLNALLEALDIAGDAVQQALGDSVVRCSGFLSGSLEQLEDDLDSPDNGQDKRSEGNGSQVVSPRPVVSERDVGVSVLFFSVPGEEPGGSSDNDNELRAGHEEAEYPDEGKDHKASLSNSLVAIRNVSALFLVLEVADVSL